ncbi:hypothetical protein M3936_17155 [Sutcliffiella horikoshii]|uniref:hypothetical protein n=1 Tax=Sutcliffiella horikoshii TaxID=79883 RepID=UPI00204002E1|nr:hypothetical protein [Sutcliffiella horikoshii]MCM3619320.1 hypothetical protein [Sutcliffiella horikoshii]
MRSFKLLVVLLICTGFVFGFSQLGVLLAGKWLPGSSSFAEATMIASEEVSNKSKAEAAAKLNDAKDKWVTDGSIYLEWTGSILSFPKDAFVHHIPETVDYAENGSQTMLKVELPDGILLEQIETIAHHNDIFSSLDTQTLKKDLENIAANLTGGDHTFPLADYLTDGAIVEQTSSEAKLSLAGTSSLNELNETLNNKEITLTGNESFSIQTWITNENVTLSDEAASIFASLIYELIAPTNFYISERHISKDLPSWASEGYEVLIQKDSMDFVFNNPNPDKYKIIFNVENSVISGELSGGPLPYEYAVSQVERKSLSPKTIVQYSATLPSNQKNVKEQGKNGTYIHLVRTATNKEGKVVESTVYSEDFYAPIQRVEQHSLSKPVIANNPVTTVPPGNVGSNTNTGTNPTNNTGGNTVIPPGSGGNPTNSNPNNTSNTTGNNQSNNSGNTGSGTTPPTSGSGNGNTNTETTPSNPGQGSKKEETGK